MAEDVILDDEAVEVERNVVFEEAVEAILFAAGHPVTYATLARVFEMTPAKVKDKIFEYSLAYNNPDMPRGVVLPKPSEPLREFAKWPPPRRPAHWANHTRKYPPKHSQRSQWPAKKMSIPIGASSDR